MHNAWTGHIHLNTIRQRIGRNTAGYAGGMLVGRAEVPETSVDTEDMAKVITASSNDTLQLYCKKNYVYGDL